MDPVQPANNPKPGQYPGVLITEMAKKSTVSPSKRDEREARRLKARRQQYIRWVLLGALALVVVGVIVWFGTRPATAMGDEVEVGDFSHVPAGSDPGPYASDPPAGGKHYPSTFRPGFYDETSAEAQEAHPEGSLVHNLEHGYVIFWYNCQADTSIPCDELKSTIRRVMDNAGTDELIAFPWPTIEQPLVMTSWGRIMRFTELDTNKMAQFVKVNLNQSPEPDAR
jgi:hypothetical protein